MMDLLVTLLSILALTFVVCSIIGIFRARADIKKHKSDDCTFRKSRKEVIFEKQNADINSAGGADVLRRISALSDDERQEFERQLRLRFEEGSGHDC